VYFVNLEDGETYTLNVEEDDLEEAKREKGS
jgi:hypothetical protein